MWNRTRVKIKLIILFTVSNVRNSRSMLHENIFFNEMKELQGTKNLLIYFNSLGVEKNIYSTLIIETFS
jgi:hypothetical protein